MSEAASAEEAVLADISLDEAFAPEPEKEPEPTTGEEAKPDAEEAKEEVSAEEAEPEKSEATEDKDSTPEPDKDDDSWRIAAVMDEREKRQKAQEEAENLRKEIEALKGDKTEKTSVFDNEEGFRNELLTEFDQQRINDRLNMSQALAEREFGKDKVAEAVESFRGLAEGNAELSNRFASAPLPYHELMDIVSKHNELKALENVDEYKDKLRAEIRAEIEAEAKAKADKDTETREAITPSLASARSTGGNDEPLHLESVEEVLPS